MQVNSQGHRVSALAFGADVWLVTCPVGLGTREAVDELQDACLSALDHGARRLVVDLSGVTAVSLDGLRLLLVVADILLAQGNRLLLASRSAARASYHLLALEGGARAALGRIVAERSRELLSGRPEAEGAYRER